MKCPLCKSIKIIPHLQEPIIYGSRNNVQYYSCEDCGILFVPTLSNKVTEHNKCNNSNSLNEFDV